MCLALMDINDWLEDRIKQRVQMQTQKDKLTALDASPSSQQGQAFSNNQLQDLLSPTRKQANRRRELYDQLVHLRRTTAKRVHKFETQYRSTRASRELLSAKIAVSCENRLRFLQQQQGDVSTSLPGFDKASRSSDPNQFQEQTARFQAETQYWDAHRQAQAWQSHLQIVQAIKSKQKWWQTSIAGSEKDIRRVYASSPWETERKVWTWPPRHEATKCTTEASNSNSSESPEQQGPSHSSDIDAFIFSLNRSENQCPTPVDDQEASEWWRAHCMQPHLVISERENDQHETNNNNDEDEFHHRLWSSEALANPTFHRLYVQSQRRNQTKEHKLAVNTLIDRFQKHVNQRVGEVEMQIEVNTKLQQDIVLRRQQIKKRRTREENAVVSIQRVFRGLQGRKEAQQVRAEFFVMVKGRAIRKGKCEECGEQQAVLECNECEESLHFCPVCWVQVHATRRRKLHVAIPMSVAVSASRRVVAVEVPVEGYRARAPPTTSTTVATASKKPQTQSEAVRGAFETTGGAKPAANEEPRIGAAGKPQTLKAKTTALTSSAKKEANSVTPSVERWKPNASSEKARTSLSVAMETAGDDSLFDSQNQSGGDSSCPPVLEDTVTTESEPQPSEAVLPDLGETSKLPKPVAAAAATTTTSKRTTPTNAASKAVASRSSLKQQREGSASAKSEVAAHEGGDTTSSATPGIRDAAVSHVSVKASSASAALDTSHPPAQVKVKPSLDSSESPAPGATATDSTRQEDIATITSKAKAPARVSLKHQTPAEGQNNDTEEIETKPRADRPSDTDTSHESVEAKNEEVRKAAQPVKAKPAGRTSLKERMKSASSTLVQREAAPMIQRSETTLSPHVAAEPLSVDTSGGGVIAHSSSVATSFESAPMGEANEPAALDSVGMERAHESEATISAAASHIAIAHAEHDDSVVSTSSNLLSAPDAAAAADDDDNEPKPLRIEEQHDDELETKALVPSQPAEANGVLKSSSPPPAEAPTGGVKTEILLASKD